MLLPPDERVRVVLSAVPGDWAAACAGFAGGVSIKDHGRGTVWRGEVLGRACVLKCERLGTARRLAQALLRCSPAWRQWRGARWLAGRGIGTAGVLAIVRGRRGGERVECLVMERVSGGTVLEWMAREGAERGSRGLVAEAVGRLASRVAAGGRVNRDAKASNLIVTGVGGGGAELAVVDCGDLRRRRGDDEGAVARMLASAVLEGMGCGCAPSRSECMRAVRAAGGALRPGDARGCARRLWRAVEGIVGAHGDPRPAVDPLGPRGGPGGAGQIGI